MQRIVIFANGELPDPQAARRLIQPEDRILCADGGSHHALELGLRPEVVIGDLDSIDVVDRGKIEAAGIPVRQYSHDKNETDLELALGYAREQRPSAILIVAALGRRLDQTLGNLALLTDPALASLDVRLDDGIEEVFFCRGHAQVQGKAGDLVSLIPWGSEAAGVRTAGLRWALRDETLFPMKTRGISNELSGPAAEIDISSGLLLVIHRRQP